MAITLAKTLRLLAAEKRAVLQRQTALVANLNKLLPSIGYRVVPLEGEGRADARSNLRGRRSTALSLLNKSLVCRYCQRTFALPLHLGRHMSVMHKVKSASTPPPHSAAGGEHPAARPTRKSRRRAAGRRARGRSTSTTVKKTARKALSVKQSKG